MDSLQNFYQVVNIFILVSNIITLAVLVLAFLLQILLFVIVFVMQIRKWIQKTKLKSIHSPDMESSPKSLVPTPHDFIDEIYRKYRQHVWHSIGCILFYDFLLSIVFIITQVFRVMTLDENAKTQFQSPEVQLAFSINIEIFRQFFDTMLICSSMWNVFLNILIFNIIGKINRKMKNAFGVNQQEMTSVEEEEPISSDEDQELQTIRADLQAKSSKMNSKWNRFFKHHILLIIFHAITLFIIIWNGFIGSIFQSIPFTDLTNPYLNYFSVFQYSTSFIILIVIVILAIVFRSLIARNMNRYFEISKLTVGKLNIKMIQLQNRRNFKFGRMTSLNIPFFVALLSLLIIRPLTIVDKTLTAATVNTEIFKLTYNVSTSILRTVIACRIIFTVLIFLSTSEKLLKAFLQSCCCCIYNNKKQSTAAVKKPKPKRSFLFGNAKKSNAVPLMQANPSTEIELNE